MQVLEALLEQDREELCRPKRKHHLDREAYRYGYDQGSWSWQGGRCRWTSRAFVECRATGAETPNAQKTA